MEELNVPYEPKVKNRFILTLPEVFGLNESIVKSMEMPSIDIESGKWNPMKIRFYDPVSPSTSQKIWDIYRAKTGNNIDKIPVSEELINLLKFGFDLKLGYLDPSGIVISVWEMSECFITKLDFGIVDYSEVGIATCGITINSKYIQLLY